MNDAEKREKVIRGLECCALGSLGNCEGCPYTETRCSEHLCGDALVLLKQQEPRVMTPYEARAEYEIVWLDRKNISCEVAILQRIACSMYEFSIMGTDEMPSLLESQYGKTWRCWTSRPMPEQMRETKWEGEKE